jgi:hypothetical protein
VPLADAGWRDSLLTRREPVRILRQLRNRFPAIRQSIS